MDGVGRLRIHVSVPVRFRHRLDQHRRPVQVGGGAALGADVVVDGLRLRLGHAQRGGKFPDGPVVVQRSEEHTSELQSLMRISYAVFCLKNKTTNNTTLRNKTQVTTKIQ